MEQEKIYVHDDDNYCRRSRYATHGEALGVGIPALALAGVSALALFGGRRGWGGWGSNMPENVNINNMGNGVAGQTQPTAFEAWEKSCDDAIALTNTIWQLQLNSERQAYAHREVDVNEKFQLYKSQIDADFGLYKSQIDADFGLYKSQRDGFDVLSARIGNLETRVAVNEAVRPYQDRLIQCEIDKAYTASINHTDRLDCRNIKGQVVLPSTPTVTGYGSYYPCQCPTSTPAAASVASSK